MIKPERLFDCIAYQLEKFPKPDMLAAKENGIWRKYSTIQISDTVNALASGLSAIGISGNDLTVEQQDKIAIISGNRPEWLITDMAVQKLGAVLVPIYPTTNNHEIEFIFRDAGVKYVFAGNKELLEKIRQVRANLPDIRNIYTFDQIEDADHWSSLLLPVTATKREELESISNNIRPEHLATIIYTSGTTGTPKGVMLTHRNILSNVMLSKESFPFEDRPDYKVLSFLPLNHIFEKMVSYIYLYSGNSIYYAESLETIGANLLEVKPDLFTTVPRLLEKVYERIMAKGAALKGIKRNLFFWAVELGKRYDNNRNQGWWYSFQLSLANKLIFNKWREGLGNNIKYIITGGAACQERLLRIFNGARIPVYEGYGPTENSPVISVNRRGPGLNRLGTVGPILNGVDFRLEADGEICVSGPSVMKGYFKRPDLTSETIIDGWLHTGDIGILEDGKFLRITDRKKELFKTSGGKYVAPSAIENKLKESRFIDQVVVVGSEMKFVGALIVPAFAPLIEWCKQTGFDTSSRESVIQNPGVKKFYRDIIDEYNKQFNHVEQIKKFELLPAEWSIETGELTPKMNFKRKIVLEKYKSYIDKIYSAT
ncbi:MAG: long-chain fatty acid--CoA ligase [Bacteroidota bacterium]|nr:long-chain fatty acid--CoA ligase [Bacteroidota bacterium]